MITAIIHIPLHGAAAPQPELEQRFATQLENVRQAPGFISFELLRPEQNASGYVSITHWESQDALMAWAGGSDSARVHGHAVLTSDAATASPPQLPPSVEVYTVAVNTKQ